jgi:hypothetical protein
MRHPAGGPDARQRRLRTLRNPNRQPPRVGTKHTYRATNPLDLQSPSVNGTDLDLGVLGSSPRCRLRSGEATLTQQINDLINGVKYEFMLGVVGTNVDTIPASNIAFGTPFAAIGAPEPAAPAGDAQVQLFWTAPATGGPGGPLSYFVICRPKGTQQWIVGPSYLSGRTTLIPELVSGTEYEFGVFAMSTDRTTSVTGITTAAPVGVSPSTPPTPTDTHTAGEAGCAEGLCGDVPAAAQVRRASPDQTELRDQRRERRPNAGLLLLHRQRQPGVSGIAG